MVPDRSQPRGPAPLEAHDARLHQFLRYCHIFSTAVREIFSTKYLAEVTKHPLTQSQFHLLKLIALNGGHQLGEVADYLGVSPPAASKNVDKLARLGLVARSRSAADRRATTLTANARGRGLVNRYEELKAKRIASLLEEFDPNEVEDLSRLLERFAVSLLRQERPGRGFCLRCGVYIEEDCPIGHVRGGCPYRKTRGEVSREGNDK
jgi:DNA-binding MarR family transcriptional regulator